MKKHPAHLAILLSSAALLPSFGQSSAELSKRIENLEKKLSAYEETRSGGNDSSIDGFYGGATAASGHSWFEKTQIGGYGELHLSRDLGGGGDNEIDFHRWVLFINHSFTDRIKLFSEFELEHSLAGDGAPGEVELEQAFIDFTLTDSLNAKVGLFLLPVGLLNETHEPNTFFGVERNNVEVNIIPTTWWEAGLALSGTYDSGFGFDVAVHSGLDVPVTGGNAFRIRSGRQKVAEAEAESGAVTARLRYKRSGLALSGFAQYQHDITQSSSNEDNSAILVGGTVDYSYGGFGLKGLIASWFIDGDTFEAADADHQWGGYIEPSYTWQVGQNQKVGAFARYSHYEYSRGTGRETDQYDLGINYWPIDNVVLKVDYNQILNKGRANENLLNFGMGYSF